MCPVEGLKHDTTTSVIIITVTGFEFPFFIQKVPIFLKGITGKKWQSGMFWFLREGLQPTTRGFSRVSWGTYKFARNRCEENMLP